MKSVSIIIFMLMTINSRGQFVHNNNRRNFSQDRMRLLSLLLKKQQQLPNARKTSIKPLLGLSLYDTGSFGKNLEDSMTFTYSGGRGSTFDYTTMSYIVDPPYTYGQMPVILYQFEPEGVFYDTLIESNPIAMYSRKVYCKYDAHNNMASYFAYYNNPLSNVAYINTYNSYDKPITSLTLWGNGTGWDSVYYAIFSYDTSNRLQKQVLLAYGSGGFDSSSEALYYYDSKNNLVSILDYIYMSGWNDTNYIYSFNYDTSDRVTSYWYRDILGGGSDAIFDSMEYSPGINFPTSLVEYTVSGGGYTGDFYFLKLLGSSHPTEILEYRWLLPWSPEYKDIYTYNSELNPLTEKQYRYNLSWGYYDSVPTLITNYYYDTISSTGINSEIKNNNFISVYPNPTTDKITVTSSSIIKSIIVTNSFGQVMYTQDCYTNKLAVDISSFKSGIYFVKLNDSEIVKLIKQ